MRALHTVVFRYRYRYRYVCMYIYMKRERERERKREREREQTAYMSRQKALRQYKRAFFPFACAKGRIICKCTYQLVQPTGLIV